MLSHNPTMAVTLRHHTCSISVHKSGERGGAAATNLSKRGIACLDKGMTLRDPQASGSWGVVPCYSNRHWCML